MHMREHVIVWQENGATYCNSAGTRVFKISYRLAGFELTDPASYATALNLQLRKYQMILAPSQGFRRSTGPPVPITEHLL
jgi:hypothetical protein